MDLESPRINQSTSPSILIADDDPALSLLLKQFLLNQHYQTFVTSRGEEALAICSEEHVDLVILDAIMPGQDGFETCKILKQKYPRLPVLILTSLDDDESVERAFAAGADDYITKPVNWSVFKHRLSKTLDYYGAISQEEHLLKKPGKADLMGARIELASGKLVTISLELEEELYQSLSFPTIRQQLVRAIQEYRDQKADHPDIQSLSIPMLPCRCDPRVYMDLLDELVKSHHLDYKELEIRVHESHLARPAALQMLLLLASRPLRIAICHFSFSINSLVFAQNMRCDRILLNLPDIAHFMNQENATAWIENGLAMYRDRDIELVGDGIETEIDLKLATRLGCRYGAGPMFQKKLKS